MSLIIGYSQQSSLPGGGLSNPVPIVYQSTQAIAYTQGGNSTMDNGSYNTFSLTADGTGTTIAHSNVPAAGNRYGFELHLNWTGGTITWPDSWTKANGIPRTQGKCVISGFTIDGGLTFNTKVDYVSDPYLNNVVLFLKGAGENNSTIIADSSLAPKTITRVGDTKISTAQSKYGESSIFYDGNGDYLNAGQNASYSLGSVDFAIEQWFFTGNTTTRQELLSAYTPTTGYGISLNVSSPRDIVFYSGNTTLIATQGGQWQANSWNHVAVSRINGILRLFSNGSKIAEQSNTTNFNLSSILYLGIGGSLAFPFTGYQSHLRITKGVGRYTDDFNPETDTYLNP